MSDKTLSHFNIVCDGSVTFSITGAKVHSAALIVNDELISIYATGEQTNQNNQNDQNNSEYIEESPLRFFISGRESHPLHCGLLKCPVLVAVWTFNDHDPTLVVTYHNRIWNAEGIYNETITDGVKTVKLMYAGGKLSYIFD